MSQEARSTRFPYLLLRLKLVEDPAADFDLAIEALVDTGFDGGVALPQGRIPADRTPIGQSMWYMADGTELRASAYLCYVSIGNLEPVPTAAIALDGDTLLGRHVTDRFRLIFDHGISIVVEP